jgi:hypothetical protein
MNKPATIRLAAAMFLASLLLFWPGRSQAQNPTVSFVSPTNNQTMTGLASISGTAVPSSGSITSVTFEIREVSLHGSDGRWWNGTNFQNSLFRLPADVAGTNWTSAPSVVMPALNSGISYDLIATATDNAARSNSVSITVLSPIASLRACLKTPDLFRASLISGSFLAVPLETGDAIYD